MRQKTEKIVFIWFATGVYGKEICPGPHYISDIVKIGKKLNHTLDELLKMNVSDSIKKKLTKVKPGSSVKINNLHANGDLYVKRLNENQIEKLEEFRKTHKKIIDAFNKLKELKVKKDKLQSFILKK